MASTVAAGALARRAFSSTQQRIVVVGAGAFGGWTALQLRQKGADVTLLDAWGPGNSRASSGGETRVIRAIYGADRVYVEMVKRSYELWEALDPSLYVETGALWMHRGDDAYVRSALPILQDLGFIVDKFTVSEAARRAFVWHNLTWNNFTWEKVAWDISASSETQSSAPASPADLD